MLIEEEIKKVKVEIHNAWFVNNDWDKAKELTVAARSAYPNDYEIMINFLFFTSINIMNTITQIYNKIKTPDYTSGIHIRVIYITLIISFSF